MKATLTVLLLASLGSAATTAQAASHQQVATPIEPGEVPTPPPATTKMPPTSGPISLDSILTPFDDLPEAKLVEVRRFVEAVQKAYPSEAVEKQLEGAVTVRVRVNAQGRASICEVVVSSGHTILDYAACTATMRHARFKPPVDDAGNPVEGGWSETLKYALS